MKLSQYRANAKEVVSDDERVNSEKVMVKSKIIGEGAFAIITALSDDTVVKTLKPEYITSLKEVFLTEIETMLHIGYHPNVVQLRDVRLCCSHLSVELEYLQGDDLITRLADLEEYHESKVRMIFKQMAQAVAHIHAHNIVHMDIKPENFVFANSSQLTPLKIIDFGLSTKFHKGCNVGGTYEYLAPEILINNDAVFKNGCGPEVDIWSLGILLYFLFSGTTPFWKENEEEMLLNIKQGKLAWRGGFWNDVTAYPKSLIVWMLQRDPSKRCTIQQILNHEWLQSTSKNVHTKPLSVAQKRFKAISQSMKDRIQQIEADVGQHKQIAGLDQD